jgi:hypothetical protein
LMFAMLFSFSYRLWLFYLSACQCSVDRCCVSLLPFLLDFFLLFYWKHVNLRRCLTCFFLLLLFYHVYYFYYFFYFFLFFITFIILFLACRHESMDDFWIEYRCWLIFVVFVFFPSQVCAWKSNAFVIW